MAPSAPARSAEASSAVDAASTVARGLWPGISSPSDFLRINVLELRSPSRHMITVKEPDEEQPLFMSFLAFETEMPHTCRVTIEVCKDYPPRWRLSREGKATQRRDLARWQSTDVSFYVHATAMPGTTALHLDWQTAPDRYQISEDDRPKAMMTRCFTFFAFKTCQVYIMRPVEGCEACKLFLGHVLEKEDEWSVVASFHALVKFVTGTNRYHVQYQSLPFYRTRIGMTAAPPSSQWTDQFSLYAFDLHIPGTHRWSVSQRSSVPGSMQAENPEQYKLDAPGSYGTAGWNYMFALYAFPAKPIVCR